MKSARADLGGHLLRSVISVTWSVQIRKSKLQSQNSFDSRIPQYRLKTSSVMSQRTEMFLSNHGDDPD